MTVPYTFGGTPSGSTIPLSHLDDNFAAIGSSDNINFTPSGTGANSRTVESKLRDMVSVFDFMTPEQIADVQARTGLVDVSGPIQDAINSVRPVNDSAPEKGGAIYLPPGLYMVNTSINLYSGVVLSGAGITATSLYAGPSLAGQIIYVTTAGPNGYCSDAVVQDIMLQSVASIFDPATRNIWAINGDPAIIVGNCTFQNIKLMIEYGIKLDSYTQDCIFYNIMSVGPVNQILNLKGNWNRIESISKEAGTGDTVEPYVYIGSNTVGTASGNYVKSLLLEGNGSANKTPLKFENADADLVDYWHEVNASNGYVLELDNSAIRIKGVLTNGPASSARYKLRNGSYMTIEQFSYSYEQTDEWQQFFDYDDNSYVIAGNVSGQYGLGVYKLSASGNLFLENFVDQRRVLNGTPGLSPIWKPHYRSGQNLLVNPSFEAGMYGWINSGVDTPTFTPSETGQGLMFQCSTTTGFALYQNVVVTAAQIGQPLTLCYAMKIDGAGFATPIHSDYDGTTDNRVYPNSGWQTITFTYRPQTAGTFGFGFSLQNVGGTPTTIYVDDISLAAGDEGLLNTAKFGSIELNQKTITYAAAPPSTGTWKLGDTVYNSQPSSGEYEGWTCTVAGSPGTWVGFGTIDLAGSSGSSYVGFVQPYTGSEVRSVQSKLRDIVSVFDFMTTAEIADVQARTGLIDVSGAIQDAINAVKSVQDAHPEKGGTVYFPPGLYMINNTINMYSGITLTGSGTTATSLYAGPSLTGQIILLTSTGPAGYCVEVIIENLKFQSVNSIFDPASRSIWAVKTDTTNPNLVVGSVTIRNILLWIEYGFSFRSYSQNCVFNGIMSVGPLNQLLTIKGNWNKIENISKEAGTGTSVEPYIYLGGPLGPGDVFTVNGALLRNILIEGNGSANKSAVELVNATADWTEYWQELGANNSFTISMDKSALNLRGYVTNGSPTSHVYKLRNGSRLFFEEFIHGYSYDYWQSYFDCDAGSIVTIDTIYTLLGLNIYEIEKSQNFFINKYVAQNILFSPVAGRSPLSKPHYRSGQNLLINPSFEAGMYGWGISPGASPTFTQSEVGQGLMFQCTTTSNIGVSQGFMVLPQHVGQPMTLTYVAKLEGEGFVYPVIADDYASAEGRIYAGQGWQTVTITYRPQAAGIYPAAFGLNTANITSVPTTLYIDEVALCFGDEGIINTSKFGSFELNGKTVTYASAPPADGTWKAGDTVYNSQPSSGEYEGWTCTVAGTPGTWEGFGIINLGSNSGSSYIKFVQPYTGSEVRSVESRLRDTVSVFDFMTAAEIADVQARSGLVDVSGAIQDAINAVKPLNDVHPEKGGTVYFPPGLYMVNTPINLYSGITLSGSGPTATSIYAGASLTGRIIYLTSTGPANYCNHTVIENLQFQSVPTIFDPAARSIWAVEANTGIIVGNCIFHNILLKIEYGFSLYGYTQDCVINEIVSVGPVNQILRLKGNFNKIESITKEAGTGSTTEPYILLGDTPVYSVVGAMLKSILIEGSGSVNKPAVKFQNAGAEWIDFWQELSTTNGFNIDMDNSYINMRGLVTHGGSNTHSYKLRNGSRLYFDEFVNGYSYENWQNFFDYDANSIVTIDTCYNLLGLDVYEINKSANLFVNKYIAQNILTSVVAGRTALCKPHYRSGQNLLINPSFEAGMYGWGITPGASPTFVQSEVGQGLMFQCTTTSNIGVSQGFMVLAAHVGQPITLTYVAKLEGEGFVYPVIADYYATAEGRIYAGQGWQTVTITFRPQAAGAFPAAFGLNTANITSVSSTLYIDEVALCFGDEGIINTAKFGSFELNGKTVTYAAAAPVDGTWKVGDRVFNSAPAVGAPKGWICTVAGTPGTWVSEGNL